MADTPLLLLLGCSELSKPLRERGMQTSVVRSPKHLLQPRDDLQARGIVIEASALKGFDLDVTIPRLRDLWPLVDIVLWYPKASATFVRSALSAGARDVLLSPSPDVAARAVVSIVASQQLLPRAARLDDEKEKGSSFEGMMSRSRRMWDLFYTATQVAATDATVLILGETGTGKELLARALHRRSERDGRFVAINCGAVNETLIDSELFGHVKGSFTGAAYDKEGLFKHAEAGTLFLDEIGNVPLAAQYHLLRALQEGTVRPVGGEAEVNVDVRVIAATSSALEEDVQRGRFREDLFYRLDVIRLEIPPLRDRPEDIVFLFAHFAKQIAEEYNIERPNLRDDFLDALIKYDWPGNVRQLQNFTERLVLTHANRRVGASHIKKLLPFRGGPQSALPGRPRRQPEPLPTAEAPETSPQSVDTTKTLEETLRPQVEELERSYLEAALAETEGKVGKAASIAGLSRRTLLRKMKQYGIDKASFRSE